MASDDLPLLQGRRTTLKQIKTVLSAGATGSIAGCGGNGGAVTGTPTGTDNSPGTGNTEDTASGTDTADQRENNSNQSAGPNIYQEHPELFVDLNTENFTRIYSAIHNQGLFDSGASQPGHWNVMLENLTNGAISFEDIKYQVQGGDLYSSEEDNYIALKSVSDTDVWGKITEVGEEISSGLYRLDSKAPDKLDTVAQEYKSHIVLNGQVNIIKEEKPDASPLANQWRNSYKDGKTVKNSQPEIWGLTKKSGGAKAEVSSITIADDGKIETEEFGTDYRAMLTDHDLNEGFVEIKSWALGHNGNIVLAQEVEKSYQEMGYN